MVHDDPMHAGLRALLDDLLDGAAAANDECDAMRRNLDLYVHDELEGRDAAGRQPALSSHLQTCADCREQHDMLLSLLTAEARGELTPLPPRPAIAPVPSLPPWKVVVEPGPSERPALVFVFLPTYLRDSLRRNRVAEGWRTAPGQPASETLLLSYLGETPAGEALVQIYARPVAGEPAQCMLTVIAAAEPMPRTAELAWGGHTARASLDADGAGQLGPAPLAALDDAEAYAFSIRLQL